ncbi:MAG: hypothetical protein P8Y44_02810 [Acidobacteriota bacterium]
MQEGSRPALLPLFLLTIATACGCSPDLSAPTASNAGEETEDTATVTRDRSAPKVANVESNVGLDIAAGEGFVVWESNRTGRWRIWIRDLAGGQAAQLTPDDGPRIHCCPHISPDGAWIAYLELEADQKGYPRGGALGSMVLVRSDGSDSRQIVNSARNYFENRAAVWRTAESLIFITAEHTTSLLDVRSGTIKPLTRTPVEDYPWLIDPELRWATRGDATFAPYDRKRLRVLSRPSLEGCQSYFTADGRFGYWVAAPGGPLRWIRLETLETGTLLKKSDPRLPPDRGYLYFPMISSDLRLLAFAASDDEHAHFEANYDIFVAALAGDDLQVLGSPRRITDHPATDRFPDVFQKPLPLGNHTGEAPYRWKFTPPGSGEVYEWSYGDGERSEGESADHLYATAGRYLVTASRGGISLRGWVEVLPASPPRVLSTHLFEDGAEVEVLFDEPISLEEQSASLRSGIAINELSTNADGTRLRLVLDRPIRSPDELQLKDLSDRARNPNRAELITITIEPPSWPSDRRGLVVLWQSGNSANLVLDREAQAETATILSPRGLARLDHNYALVPGGGSFIADDASMHRLKNASQRTNEISLELTVTPAEDDAPGAKTILTAAGKGWTNFALGQKGRTLVFDLRNGGKGAEGVASVQLFELPRAVPSHVAVTFSSGRLRAYLDGVEIVSTETVRGGFFHWRTRPLIIGSDWNGRHPWQGSIEGLAIYDRVLDPVEVRENYNRYRASIDSRPQIDRWRVGVVLVECSEKPTVEQIAPYRQALVACDYRIEQGDGELVAGSSIRVARWALLDARSLSLPEPGAAERLQLTRYRDNPQLESHLLSDTLGESQQTPLFYSSGPSS